MTIEEMIFCVRAMAVARATATPYHTREDYEKIYTQMNNIIAALKAGQALRDKIINDDYTGRLFAATAWDEATKGEQ